MEMMFNEMFPALTLPNDLSVMMDEVLVTRASINKENTDLKLHISSSHIIQRNQLHAVADYIRRQQFSGRNIAVSFVERYDLSKQYNVSAIVKSYMDSILEELNEKNKVLHELLNSAEISADDDTLNVTLIDSYISKRNSAKLKSALITIFEQRFGIPCNIVLSYKEPEKSEIDEYRAHIEREKIKEIFAKADAADNDVDNADGESSEDSANASEAENIGTSSDFYTTGNTYKVSNTSDAGNALVAGDESKLSATSKAGNVSELNGSSGVGEALELNDTSRADKALNAGSPSNADNTLKPAGTGNNAEPVKKKTKAEKTAYKSTYNKKEYKKSKQNNEKSVSEKEDKDVFYGRSVDSEYTPIRTALIEQGGASIRGQIISVEERGRESTFFLVEVYDFMDSITVKVFAKDDEQAESLKANFKVGSFIACEGTVMPDRFGNNDIRMLNVKGIKHIKDFRLIRNDNALTKRVELHCHTKLSKMDAVCAPEDVVKRAAKWGHPAVAITDHGNVQGFTKAYHELSGVRKQHPDFKIIYGMEGYLVDDLVDIAVNVKDNTLDDDYVVFDIETTGLSSVKNNIIEIGAVKVSNGSIVDRFSTFVNPKEPIPYRITKLTSITNEDVIDAPFISEVLPKFLEFSKGCVFVAHNAEFDMGFIKQNARRLSINFDPTYFDTLMAARILLPNLGKHTLDNVCKTLKISLENHHRAVDDAEATAHIFINFVKRLKDKGLNTLDEVNSFANGDDEKVNKVKKIRNMYHIILLAANELGRINLYRLVSMSNLKYFHMRPRIPKSELIKHREGLIIGSACEAGELFRAIEEDADDAEIRRIAGFYDYLEIQPVGNNEFLLREENNGIDSIEDLKNLNKKIVELGDELCKPVVATTDAHFLDPEDEIYRRIVTSPEYEDSDNQAPLYFRTTEEMIAEFDYLGIDKAYEVVVTNSNKINNMIEYIDPVRPDKCPPVIENSDVELKTICFENARKQYGETLPALVQDRLDKELNSIIKNGFAVMYIIAQKLVKDSNDHGYVVGSRGSVGSSFVATMSGISEVNPLPPHYYCTSCHYTEFDSEEIRASSGLAGCDMPDKNCPKCGAKLKKDGFDIPFETFLGFYGEKEPDIDLNFSSEYQAEAHKYTEVIFGEGNTFKAGTVLSVADKTASGYVWKYYSERGIKKSNAEIDRIALGLTNVKSGTSQHPGGIVVLPHGEEIHTFTPIQHPADKVDSDMITTHFDYHAIDHNLLKLDILGHKNPTMIKRFAELTGTDPTEVSLDDKDVLSLFQKTDALNITPEDIGGCKLGCLGIPEFGTEFAIGMLLEANPQSVSDLVRISGLAHGTRVWQDNAQVLISEGKATIATAICTRDDIMTYLIRQGLEAGDAFKIMELVRKGAVAKKKCDNWGDYKEKMQAAGVPDWYIWSCERIEYMFPKAHAAAYVTMACRIGYYKIHYPLAFYAAYFSILADAFDYEKMCLGIGSVKAYLTELRSRDKKSLNDKEKKELKDLCIVEEMYARGIEFAKLDIFVADADNCKVVDGKVMPHIASIGGMGSTAAQGIVEAVKDGPFLSKDSFRERSKVSKTIADKIYELGLLGDIPESDQMSIFDFMKMKP